MLYVLKGNIPAYHDQVFGVYDSLTKLKQAAEDIIGQDFAVAEQAQADYGFSGLVYYPVTLNKTENVETICKINWNKAAVEATLSESNKEWPTCYIYLISPTILREKTASLSLIIHK